MKIVGEYLVVLPVFGSGTYSKIYKVIETDKGKFYREHWMKGDLHYQEVDAEVFYEENSKESLVVSK